MDLSNLTEFLVKSIVTDEENVSVKQFDDDDMVTIEVLVSSDDMGRAIGKNGMIAKSIRTIVQASGHLNGIDHVKVNIDSF